MDDELYDGWAALHAQSNQPDPIERALYTSTWNEAMGELLLADNSNLLERLGVISVRNLISR